MKTAIIKSSVLADGGPWSAEYRIEQQRGRQPYRVQAGRVVDATGTLSKRGVFYLFPAQVRDYQDLLNRKTIVEQGMAILRGDPPSEGV